jgi:hypothetical protein
MRCHTVTAVAVAIVRLVLPAVHAMSGERDRSFARGFEWSPVIAYNCSILSNGSKKK